MYIYLAPYLLFESSLQFPSAFPELQKAMCNVHVTVFYYYYFFFISFHGGGGVAAERGWRGHSTEKEEEGGRVVCPRRQMAWGAGP